MKTIVIGDIHGREIWKDIINKHSDFDRVIFVGDYFDTKENITGAQQLYNFEEICRFSRANEGKIIMLLGNHDHHYYPGIRGGSTTGYQLRMAPSYTNAIDVNKDLLKMAFVDENNYVYSHAGITKTWVTDVGLDPKKDIKGLIDDINDLLTYRPNVFTFYSFDRSGYGQNIHQSPIWVRPESLKKDNIDYTQFVGHTMVDNIRNMVNIWLIDSLGLSKEFIVLDGGVIEIDKIS